MRQIIKFASVTKVFRKVDSQQPNRYDMENLTSKKNTLFANWALGEEFSAEALDGFQRKVYYSTNEKLLLSVTSSTA